MLEEEVATIVGPKGRHSQARTAYRHGHEEGTVVLGGRKVTIAKPRVRSKAGQEVVLQVFERFQAEDALHQAAMDRMLHGISTRRRHKGLEDIGSGIDVQGISKSSISRNFMHRTRQALIELLERRFDSTHFVALFIDGFALGEHLVITAMGLDAEGQKHILSIREGATENAQVCKDLLNELVERGFDANRGLLAVLDGSKALRAAVVATFGDKVLIQRCQVHKLRNVLDYLPDSRKAEVKHKMRPAWAETDADQAKRKLEMLADSLKYEHPDAAGSLREGLEETLTVVKLALPGTLKKTLRSTNPMESAFDGTATHTRNVKRWRNGEQALRWMAAALLEVEKRFRRIKGYKEIPVLIDVLAKSTGGLSTPPEFKKEAIA
ncbi:MAG: IS256 family transposase [Firmicutes bacterium]|nr:IS256 family transposase [Bacillota bacterium]